MSDSVSKKGCFDGNLFIEVYIDKWSYFVIVYEFTVVKNINSPLYYHIYKSLQLLQSLQPQIAISAWKCELGKGLKTAYKYYIFV